MFFMSVTHGRMPYQKVVGGKNISYNFMKKKLMKVWCTLSIDFNIMDVDNGFYMIKFDLYEDKKKLTTGGLCIIFLFTIIIC